MSITVVNNLPKKKQPVVKKKAAKVVATKKKKSGGKKLTVKQVTLQEIWEHRPCEDEWIPFLEDMGYTQEEAESKTKVVINLIDILNTPSSSNCFTPKNRITWITSRVPRLMNVGEKISNFWNKLYRQVNKERIRLVEERDSKIALVEEEYQKAIEEINEAITKEAWETILK